MKSAKIEISGSTDTEGVVSGKGSLTLGISDAAKAGLHIDYSRPDRVKITLKSSVGFKLRKAKTLKFSGAVSKDLKTRQVDGTVTLKLEVPARVALTLQQRFQKKGTKTSLSVTLHF
jgi:hypothetical protein